MRRMIAGGLFWLAIPAVASPPDAAAVSALCTPHITADRVVASAADRLAAGKRAEPPLTDEADGFAWPDTPLGIVKDGGHYLFFGSDGGLHSVQRWHGQTVGNGKYGSMVRTIGTLDAPLGTNPPIDVTLTPNPDPGINPFYASYQYIGGGPVIRVPAGKPGAGQLLMVYHAEIPTVSTASFYAVLGLAASDDNGRSWTDLGEIIRVNQGYRSDLDGFDIGDSSLVLSPDGQYFELYFPDWRANGTTHWNKSVSLVSVARAPVDAVLDAAFGGGPTASRPHVPTFQKYADGWAPDQGLGGYSTDLNTSAPYGGTLQVAFNAGIGRYQMLIDGGSVLYYSESPDGLHWSPPTLFHDFSQDPDQPNVYATFVGTGEDASVLGRQFEVFYTRYPTTGAGWPGATVNRYTVSCE